MPLRTAEVRELCRAVVPAGNSLAACKTKTDDGCPRCGLPLCERHLPADGMRCRDCETAYSARLRENIGRYVIAAAAVLGCFGSVTVALAFLFGSVVAVLPVAALSASLVVVVMSPVVFDRVFGRAIPRRAFLKERVRSRAGG